MRGSKERPTGKTCCGLRVFCREGVGHQDPVQHSPGGGQERKGEALRALLEAEGTGSWRRAAYDRRGASDVPGLGHVSLSALP